jgi:hypothetical protein
MAGWSNRSDSAVQSRAQASFTGRMAKAARNRACREGYGPVVTYSAALATDEAQVARAAAQQIDDLFIPSELPTELIVQTSIGSAPAGNRL